MTHQEALEWLRGERSMWNLIREADLSAEAHATTAKADAAMTEQAYWVVRAHREGLLAKVWNPEVEAKIAGLLSTIESKPSEHHPEEMLPMARAVLAVITEEER